MAYDEAKQNDPYPDGEQEEEKPQRTQFEPGDLAPFWYSPHADVLGQLSDKAKAELKHLCDLIGNKDVAARRWEVEQSWEARLFDRGYQYLLPRRGGGWVLPPFATDYSRGRGRSGVRHYGFETNIYTTYGEIITAALTRDVPEGRFQPKNPESDADVTAAEAASKFAKCFAKSNDLLDFQHQLVYYLRTDGRAVIDTEFIIDAQRFGRMDPSQPEPAVPETEMQEEQQALLYLVRHGETERNADHVMRGRAEDETAQLDTSGKQESSASAEWLKNKGIGRIVSSPVGRSLQSASLISKASGIPVETDERFASRDVGDLEGQPTEDAGKVLSENSEKPEEELPGGGESQDQLDQRVQEGLFELMQTPGQSPTAVVTHDSVISSAFRLLHGENVPPADMVEPGGVAGIFPVAGGGFTIRPVFPDITPAGNLPAEQGEPRGQEVVEALGKLEAKVPINAQCQSDFPWVQISREYDYALAKAMFPEHADEIKAGSAGAGENELDRIARINACLALEASYVTGDSMVRDCTVQRTWMRPGWFMEVKDLDVREEFFKFFPQGALVVFAGEALVLARNENMDDHLTTVVAGPGSGMNRMALCSKLLSIQKRLNNWVDLINDFFIRTIPSRVVDAEVFDVTALTDQPASVGEYVPVKRQGGYADASIPLSNAIFVEPSPTHQPTLPDFIQLFINDLPQLLVGALPSLFGSQSNNDSMNPSSGVALGIQRDQALGRLGTPWHNLQMATCSYMKQAVQLAARCRKEPVQMAGDSDETIRIELADLKGDVLVYPEESSDIPQSWNQRQARYEAMIAEAGTNPFLAQLLANPANAKLAHDMAGMDEGFVIPQAEAWEKQMGEMEVIFAQAPVPNPQKIQAQMQLQQAAALQMPIDPMQVQQIAAMPDMISSVPVDEQCDDHTTEAACCLYMINGPEGRKMKNGTQQERDGFQNLRLHYLRHAELAKQNAPPPPTKPLSVSANVKDMPPRAAAAELAKRGLPTTPNEIAVKQGETS